MSVSVADSTQEQLTFAPPADAATEALSRDQRDLEFLRLKEVPPPVVGVDPLPLVDLFAGCGGLTIGAIEGARRAGRGAFLALAADDEESFLSVLKQTLGGDEDIYKVGDISAVLRNVGDEVTVGENEFFSKVPSRPILLAGPPCQGHSALNNHTRHDDARNDLYLAVARAAEIVRPRAVIIENVRGVGSDRRRAMAQCVAALRALGYEVDARRLDLHALGVPQRRVRHVVVATLGAPFEWNLPHAPGRTVGWAIRDLLRIKSEAVFDIPAKPTDENQARIDYLFDEKVYDLPNERRPKCHHDDHSYVSMYGRLNWNAPAQTITSGFGSMGQGRYVHPLRRRTLTPHEAARLQCLPDFMAFEATGMRRTALATTIGNVAPPFLSAALIEALIKQDLA